MPNHHKSPPINRLFNDHLSVNRMLSWLISRTGIGHAKKPQVWCYDEVWHIAAKQLDGYWVCTHAVLVRCAVETFSWYSAFNFVKNMKYAFVRKCIKVYVCQKLSKYSMVWQSYCENKMVQFFFTHVVCVILSVGYLPVLSFRWIKGLKKIAGSQLLITGCLLMMQLQEAGVTLDNELQRLDILESEADQRFFCLLVKILTSALWVVF